MEGLATAGCQRRGQRLEGPAWSGAFSVVQAWRWCLVGRKLGTEPGSPRRSSEPKRGQFAWGLVIVLCIFIYRWIAGSLAARRLPTVLVFLNTSCFLSVPLSRTRHAVLASKPRCYFRCLAQRRGTAPLRPLLPARPLAGWFSPCCPAGLRASPHPVPAARTWALPLGPAELQGPASAHAPSWVRVGMVPPWRHA